MRRRSRVDANQKSIMGALKRVGASITVLSNVGGGCPDLLVGHRGVNYALEIKDGSKPPSERVLTPDQVEWHRDWIGQKQVVKSEAEALEAIGIQTARLIESASDSENLSSRQRTKTKKNRHSGNG